jgi:cell division transport system ATP-binding protein
VNRPQILLADEPTGNLDPGTSIDIMQLLARINAGGTTVVMATHEAGFVDQMQRRVIELRHGEMVRDERHGGYGDRSGLPSLAPEPERGAAAVAALTAVLEVQREAAIAAAAGLDPTAVPDDDEPVVATTTPTDLAAAAAGAEAAAAVSAAEEQNAEALARAIEEPAGAGGEPEDEARPTRPEEDAQIVPPKPPPPHPQSIPVVDARELEVEELGLADRLGLGETDPDDEVGPTS